MSAPFNVHDMRDRGRESCEVNELGRDEGGECDQSDRRTPSACEGEREGGMDRCACHETYKNNCRIKANTLSLTIHLPPLVNKW